ncbi:helix-turn-helix domain-containing protein [Streptomyces sp. NPDC048305]|uniref:helix-turn-helix domain-containing protein n=1 Tax=Streptomyces sp. NPDC048305 TaxID=3365532 RepID=UPI00371507A8
MTAKLDYRWHLREIMATRGMFSTTDLQGPLAERGIELSTSQVYRLVVERPERLSLKTLMALLDVLGCSMDELIEPVAAPGVRRRSAAASGQSPTPASEQGLGSSRPKRARIVPE